MAATAYASVVSLINTIDQIMDHGPTSFSLYHEQFKSLQEKTAFLVEFLECYSNGDDKEVEDLEHHITYVSHGVEYFTEVKVVDCIDNNQSTSVVETSCNVFHPELHEKILYMQWIINEAIKIREKGEVKVQLPRESILSSSSSYLPADKDIMVGFDDVLIQIMDRLTRQQFNRLVLPISGMGGIGKTTLTRNVFDNPYIVQHFDIRAWVTISQDYQIKEILSNIICEFGVLTKEEANKMNESQLGEKLHKYLFKRRYLIVMDDMWSIDVWDKVSLFFPDNGNGSGVVITTRLSSVLGFCGLEMKFLDEEKSWDLLRKKVFGLQECCQELEEIGKEIAKNCKGLPLSIVVIAGLLAKSNMTREYWDYVAKEVNSILSVADDGQCSRILSLSYKNLPVHLKPCFLYMGVFPEDHEIKVSRLINLWVVEGFIKPNKDKSLEEVAEKYLIDLIDRNLIIVYKHGSRGNMKICKIHDLLGDLCLREAQQEYFFSTIKGSCVSQSYQSRIVIDESKKEQKYSAHSRAIPVSHFRSITFYAGSHSSEYDPGIWEMKQLRHFRVDYVNLPEAPPLVAAIGGGQEDSVLKHLQTLKEIINLTFREEVIKRIPNIKKLKLVYSGFFGELERGQGCYFNNLQHLHKLMSLNIRVQSYGKHHLLENITFPHSLEKLILEKSFISWEHMKIIGCLPNLQVLKLRENAFTGEEWNPVEGQFLSLKYLSIERSFELKFWNADSIHFPVLEQLDLHYVGNLEEIPLDIGEIPTLRLIRVKDCKDSAVLSIINILDEQEIQGNDGIRVEFVLWKHKTQMDYKNLDSRKNINFTVESNEVLYI